MIRDPNTVEQLWHIINYISTNNPSPASEVRSIPLTKDSPPSARDTRNYLLGTYITRERENEELFRAAKSHARLCRRVFLVELISNYLNEKEAQNA